jgi:hypothetical protein
LPAEKHAGEVFAHAQTFILQASRAAGIALFAYQQRKFVLLGFHHV